jgi:hypothetical protein
VRDDPERTQESPAPAGSTSADQTVFDGGPLAKGGPPPEAPPPPPPPPIDPDDVEATQEPRTRKLPSIPPPPPSTIPRTRYEEVRDLTREFLQRHEQKLWWLHTAWALSLGAFVATFAQKGFERARFLTISLGFSWLLVVLFFRFFGTGSRQDFITAWPGARRRFFIMSYLMKNLFQGMLFFLLPLYYKSSSDDAKTTGIVYLLGACAILSTLDLVFDRVLLRFKLIASLFFAITLFGSMNVAIPALFPDARIVVTLLISSALAIATFILFHIPIDVLRRPMVAGIVVCVVFGGTLLFYASRRAFPAVPMYLEQGGVGMALAPEGDLTIELKSVRASALGDLFAVTDVWTPGHGDALVHVWRRNGKRLAHVTMTPVAQPKGGKIVRVVSRIGADALTSTPAGKYTVDVVTTDGQVVGRVDVDVRP